MPVRDEGQLGGPDGGRQEGEEQAAGAGCCSEDGEQMIGEP